MHGSVRDYILHVKLNVRWLVKVEQQCWLANKRTKGIVTRHMYVIIISLSDDLIKCIWQHSLHHNTTDHGHLPSMGQLILSKRLPSSILARITNIDHPSTYVARPVKLRKIVKQVQCCIRAVP